MARYAGIDLGGTKIQAAVVDDDHEVLGQSRHQTPLRGGPSAIAAEMAQALRESCEQAGIESAELDGIGVGSPGSVDDAAGTVSSAKNLSEWGGTFALRDFLEGELGAPVALGNDVSLAVEAEFAIGAGRPYSSLLGVFWGTGVGGGIVLDGKRWTGRKSAGEIGHMVVKVGGARCPCGRRGCMEAYAGRGAMEARARKRADKGEKTVLFKMMEEKGRDRLVSGIWEKAIEREDKLALELLGEAVEALGAGIASAVNLLDPEAVVIGGGLGLRLGEPWLERIHAAMLPHLFRDADPPAVMLAQLGDLGGAQGGALLARRAAERRRPARRGAARGTAARRAGQRSRASTRSAT
jgi:glucokinase